MSRFRFKVISCAALAAMLLVGCGGSVTPSGSQNSLHSAAYLPQTSRSVAQAIMTPALLSIDANTRALEYWPIGMGGHRSPIVIANNVADAGAMAADGNLVAIVNQFPKSQVITYNVATKKNNALADPFGTAIDIAIGKDGSIYVLNIVSKAQTSNVAVYAPGSTQPNEITCGLLGVGGSIAVSNESNIYFNGYFTNNNAGVVEVRSCRALNLNPETGYIAGVTVDPKTDSLITLSDPDLCAGGFEAEMTIYPKPYQKSTAVVHEMTGNCTGGLRLNADSTLVYYGDQDVSGSFSFLRQASFPAGHNNGTYSNGTPGGFTTIPNTLPN